MLIMLLAALDGPQTAAEAEAAFARSAQLDGQWTAFRAFATEDAVMFTPQPARVQDLLKDSRNPKIAIQWWASDSYVACDGSQAVNTGPWLRALQGRVGYFTTVWARQPGGDWKWLVDGGDGLERPRGAGDEPRIRRASCSGRPHRPAMPRTAEGKSGEGKSADGTLAWRWRVAPGGARSFDAWLWDGRRMQPVVRDRIAAPPES